jgi:hypothetical protein
LKLSIGIADWDCGLGLRIGIADWDCGLADCGLADCGLADCGLADCGIDDEWCRIELVTRRSRLRRRRSSDKNRDPDGADEFSTLVATLGWRVRLCAFRIRFRERWRRAWSYLPFLLFGAPLSLVPLVGLFVALVWWTAITWTLKERFRRLALLMMVAHSCVVLLVLWFRPWCAGPSAAVKA